MKLSYRDKVIFIAAIVIVIIVVGIFLFIKPKFEEMNYAKNTLQSKQSEQEQVKAKLDTLPTIVASLKASAQSVDEIQQVFIEQQDPYLNEQYICGILGTNVTTLNMTTQYTSADPLQQYVVNPQNVAGCELFINSDLYNELPQEVYDAYNKANKRVGSSCIIGVTTMTVGYKDKKDYTGIYKFIDDIKDEGKTVIVTEFSKTDTRDMTEPDIEGTISLKLYSIYRLDVEKVMEESDEFVFDPNLVVTEETAETTAQ